MKEGKTLQELAAELDRQKDAKADYMADTRTLSMSSNGNSELSVVDVGTFGVNDNAHKQIGTRLGIPRKFYERLRVEIPDLLDHNVNTLFREKPERRMIRTLDGTARAFLSDRYRRFDNYDLAQSILPVLGEFPDMEIKSCELTDTRMYIKVVLPRIEGEVSVGDIVQAGLVITNSEVGAGALRVEPLILRLICDNGMIVPAHGMKRYHVGRQIAEQEEAAHRLYREETIKQDDKAFFMKVADVVRSVATETTFNAIVEDLRELKDKKIEGDPVPSVEKLAKTVDLTDGERGNVLNHLIQGADLSQYGLLNAVTRASQDVEDYDRATDLERIGGEIAALSPAEWKAVATA